MRPLAALAGRRRRFTATLGHVGQRKGFTDKRLLLDVRDALVQAAVEAGVSVLFGSRADRLEPATDGWWIGGEGAPIRSRRLPPRGFSAGAFMWQASIRLVDHVQATINSRTYSSRVRMISVSATTSCAL